MSKRTAVTAEAGAVASTSDAPVTPTVHPEAGWPPDEFTGIGGTYVRDPVTGVRTPVKPEAPVAPDSDTPAAA